MIPERLGTLQFDQHAGETLDQLLDSIAVFDILNLKHVSRLTFVDQVLVTGFEFIDQFMLKCPPAIPGLTRGYFRNVNLGAVFRNKVLEQYMDILQLFNKFLAAFLRVFTKHCQGSLVLTGSQHLDINILVLE